MDSFLRGWGCEKYFYMKVGCPPLIYNVEKLGTINIGRHGENLARVIEIDVSSMLKQWPDATITLLVKRNKDEAPYVAVTELVDGILYWPVTRAETAVPGNGLIEIRATRGETIAKSVTGFIRVSAALTGNETEPPEQAKSWVDQVIEYGNEATQAAIKAKEEADRLSGINAKAVTLPEGSEATVTVKDGCLVYGVPRGPKGDTGDVGPQGHKGEQGIPGADGKDAVVDTTLTQSGQAADAKATGDALAGKLTEPSTGLEVGKYFRIAAIDANGHAVLEAADLPSAPVQDVKVAGTSIVSDGVANVPLTGINQYGIVKLTYGDASGTTFANDTIYVVPAFNKTIDDRRPENGYSSGPNNRHTLVPAHLDYAVKAAMCDGKGAAWSEAEQAAARERMGIGEYKLIEEIILEEDITELVRKVDLNGNPYRFKKMVITIESVKNTATTSYLSIYNESNRYVQINMGNLSNTGKVISTQAAEVVSDKVLIWYTTPTNNARDIDSVWAKSPTTLLGANFKNICGLRYNGSFKAGSVFKIYGVIA